IIIQAIHQAIEQTKHPKHLLKETLPESCTNCQKPSRHKGWKNRYAMMHTGVQICNIQKLMRPKDYQIWQPLH
ncbi:hypothetical protein KI387_013206, partial [Taxus chinensis]